MRNGIMVGHCSQCVCHLSTSSCDQISQAFPIHVCIDSRWEQSGNKAMYVIYQHNFMTLYELPLVIIPSCLHTTSASVSSQLSSHTVPHIPLWQISTRPSYSFLPPTSRTSELLQVGTEEGEFMNSRRHNRDRLDYYTNRPR